MYRAKDKRAEERDRREKKQRVVSQTHCDTFWYRNGTEKKIQNLTHDLKQARVQKYDTQGVKRATRTPLAKLWDSSGSLEKK